MWTSSSRGDSDGPQLRETAAPDPRSDSERSGTVELQLAQVLVHLDPAAKGMSVTATGKLANQGEPLGIAIDA